MTDSSKGHILSNFETAIEKLSADLAHMAVLVERNLENAVKGLLQRDNALCNQAIADDDEVDQLEKQIDKEGLEILVLFQPVAHDLRHVVSVMKVSANLERIADQAGNIARRARKMNNNPAIPETNLIEPLYLKAASLVNDAFLAFKHSDLELAGKIKEKEDELDASYKEVSKTIRDRMGEDSTQLKDYLDLIFISRFLERVGDHAENISEDAIFVESAVDVRHGEDAE